MSSKGNPSTAGTAEGFEKLEQRSSQLSGHLNISDPPSPQADGSKLFGKVWISVTSFILCLAGRIG